MGHQLQPCQLISFNFEEVNSTKPTYTLMISYFDEIKVILADHGSLDFNMDL